MQRLLLAFLIFILLACSKSQPLVATDISDVNFGAGFSLIDSTGQTRTLNDFKNKVVVLFFGYTHCPDVCPTTLHDLQQALKLLGRQSQGVQVLFVTLDPARDTMPVLAKYIQQFDSNFLALGGSEEQIAAATFNFKVFNQKVPSTSGDAYSIDHSAGSFVFDQRGHARLYINYGEKPADIASDLRHLL